MAEISKDGEETLSAKLHNADLSDLMPVVPSEPSDNEEADASVGTCEETLLAKLHNADLSYPMSAVRSEPSHNEEADASVGTCWRTRSTSTQSTDAYACNQKRDGGNKAKSSETSVASNDYTSNSSAIATHQSEDLTSAIESTESEMNGTDHIDTKSMVTLGEQYLIGGEGVERDPRKGYKMLARAAHRGDELAIARKVDCLLFGIGVKNDSNEAYNEAYELLSENKNSVHCALRCWYYHNTGTFLQKNVAKANKALKSIYDINPNLSKYDIVLMIRDLVILLTPYTFKVPTRITQTTPDNNQDDTSTITALSSVYDEEDRKPNQHAKSMAIIPEAHEDADDSLRSALVLPQNVSKDQMKHRRNVRTVHLLLISIAVVTMMPFAVTHVVRKIGFTSSGIRAGSFAAKIMSWTAIKSGVGRVAVGGWVATLQSIGASGLGFQGTLTAVCVGVVLVALLYFL